MSHIVKPVFSYLMFAVDLIKGRYHSSNGREARLLEHVKKVAEAGNPQAVLDAIDQYAHSQEFFMNVGDDKGKILLQEMDKLPAPPKAVLELGTYCGYSTILLAAHLKDPSAKVYTIDICEENVQIAKQMIAHAGLTDKVVHVVKPLDQAVEVRDLVHVVGTACICRPSSNGKACNLPRSSSCEAGVLGRG
eukprot:GHRQ01026984.1.p1 GENE.GHRQ01026984.1~~GHRQ01026984.1.p1  ORF type:complete len:191 (+),score=61.83 GHRQ01026984.1:728-1300(+)